MNFTHKDINIKKRYLTNEYFLTMIIIRSIINLMKTIGLSGIQVLKVCGFDKEREKPQILEIDVEIETDFTELAEKDNPEYGIDLKNVYDIVIKSIEGEIFTLETIANKICKNLKNLKLAKKVKVKVKKQNPLIKGNAKFSMVMIEE